MLTIAALGSGSGGNAFVAAADREAIIIDLGFSRRELRSRMSHLRFAPEMLAGALLTHDHDDHVRGCRVFCDELNLPLYASTGTVRYLQRRGKLPRRVIEFEAGSQFSVGTFTVTAFPVPHDAADPVGFVVSGGGCRVGFATDLGTVNALVRRHLAGCDALVLESNYDPDMLRRSDRSLMLKRRIAGRAGHLDNSGAAAALADLVTPRTKLLLFAHVSRECNDPELVRECAAAELAQLHRSDLSFEVLTQDSPCGPFPLEAAAAPKGGAAV